MSDFRIHDFGPAGAHGRLADNGQPARFAVLRMSGMFPGRILAAPHGGSAYYATEEDARLAMLELSRRLAVGLPI